MSTAHGIKFWPHVFCILLLTACQDNIDELDEELARKNRPAVWNTTTSIVVQENTTEVLKLGTAASDPNNNPLTFSLQAEKDGLLFNINPSMRVLAFNTAPDYESDLDISKNHVYNVTLKINNTRRDTLVELMITVTDVTSRGIKPEKESTPQIPSITLSPQTPLFVQENSSAVITTISAVDKDGTYFDFALSGTDAAAFRVDEVSGELTFKTAPDYEKPTDAGEDNTYALRVDVNDGWSSSIPVDINVSVTAVNEAPFFPSTSITVPENTRVIGSPVAIDPDANDTLTFVLISGTDSPDAGAFTLDKTTGILSFITAPNYEKPADVGGNNIYDIEVQVTDTLGLFASTTLSITVTNIDDIIFNPNKTDYTIPENTVTIATITAVDLKGTTLPVILAGADAALFSLTYGVLRFVNLPDYEYPANANNQYHVELTATDTDASAALTETLSLTIDVTDVTSGDLDGNFGPNGQGFMTDALTGSATGRCLALTAEGKIVVAGERSVAGSTTRTDMTVWRLNADGSLDIGFNNGQGFASHPLVSTDYVNVRSLVLTANGKVVVVGYSAVPGSTTGKDMTVWRLNADGSLDTLSDNDPTNSFGPNGQGYMTAALAGDDFGYSLALTADGKIVVSGNSNAGNTTWNDMTVWRLNADGRLDTTFGPNGQGFMTHPSAGEDYGRSLALTADGKIVVTGYRSVSGSTPGNDMTVWRLNIDGSLDTTFGPNGQGFVTSALSGIDSGSSLALAADGKIVVVGDHRGSSIWDNMTVWRLNVDGSLDTTFGPNGQGFMIAALEGDSYGHSLALAADGKIVVVAGSRSSYNTIGNGDEMTVWRLNADGSLDTQSDNDPTTSFGPNGQGFMTSASSSGYSLALAADGEIVVAGERFASGSAARNNMTVWRILY